MAYQTISENDIEAWAQPEQGMILEGTYLGTQVIKTKKADSPAAIIAIAHELDCLMAGTDDDIQACPPGTQVGLFLSQNLVEPFRDLGQGEKVRITCRGKRELKNGNSMWFYKVEVDRPDAADAFDSALGKSKGNESAEPSF